MRGIMKIALLCCDIFGVKEFSMSKKIFETQTIYCTRSYIGGYSNTLLRIIDEMNYRETGKYCFKLKKVRSVSPRTIWTHVFRNKSTLFHAYIFYKMEKTEYR